MLVHGHEAGVAINGILPSFPNLQMASKTAEAGTLTEPESLGPCEPGTNINLDGIVWNETKGGELE